METLPRFRGIATYRVLTGGTITTHYAYDYSSGGGVILDSSRAVARGRTLDKLADLSGPWPFART
jgi:hypothetical protein